MEKMKSTTITPDLAMRYVINEYLDKYFEGDSTKFNALILHVITIVCIPYYRREKGQRFASFARRVNKSDPITHIKYIDAKRKTELARMKSIQIQLTQMRIEEKRKAELARKAKLDKARKI